MSQQGEPMSTTTSGSSRARSRRTGNKIPKERYTIAEVNQVGLPTRPRTVLAKFRSTCGVLGRENFTILVDDIKHVPEAEKNAAWLKFKERFEYPAADEDRLKRAALKTMGNAWKNFKSRLVTEFVLNPTTPDPTEQWPFITAEAWEQFYEKKSTPESRARSEAFRALQARNVHPHRLGTAGYVGKLEEWQEEDEAAAAANTPLVFADIPHPRARNWARARYQKNEDGTVSLPNPQDQQVYDNIVSA